MVSVKQYPPLDSLPADGALTHSVSTHLGDLVVGAGEDWAVGAGEEDWVVGAGEEAGLTWQVPCPHRKIIFLSLSRHTGHMVCSLMSASCCCSFCTSLILVSRPPLFSTRLVSLALACVRRWQEPPRTRQHAPAQLRGSGPLAEKTADWRPEPAQRIAVRTGS